MLAKIIISTFLITTLFYQVQCDENFWGIESYVADENKTCETMGFMCKDCHTSVFCVQVGDEFIEDEIPCNDGETCFDSTGQCAKGSNKKCDTESEIPFECHQTGVFADPSHCNKYFICTKTGDQFTIHNISCGNDWIFSPKTGRCTEKFEGEECPDVLPVCEKPNTLLNVKGNPSMYVLCQNKSVGDEFVLYPTQYYCNDGLIFNGTTCTDPTPNSGLDEVGKCKEKGYFYYPTDCIFYRECTGIGAAPITRSCGTGYKFNPYTHVCQMFNCNNCD